MMRQRTEFFFEVDTFQARLLDARACTAMVLPARSRRPDVGDTYYVRETFMRSYRPSRRDNGCVYLADYGHKMGLIGYASARGSWEWQNRREASPVQCRTALKITDVTMATFPDLGNPVAAERLGLVIGERAGTGYIRRWLPWRPERPAILPGLDIEVFDAPRFADAGSALQFLYALRYGQPKGDLDELSVFYVEFEFIPNRHVEAIK